MALYPAAEVLDLTLRSTQHNEAADLGVKGRECSRASV
jgi:hypothetical protein